jgi:hypothetical protein
MLDTLVVIPQQSTQQYLSDLFSPSRAENREIMARHPGVLDNGTDICMSATTFQDRAMPRAIIHLVNEKKEP